MSIGGNLAKNCTFNWAADIVLLDTLAFNWVADMVLLDIVLLDIVLLDSVLLDSGGFQLSGG